MPKTTRSNDVPGPAAPVTKPAALWCSRGGVRADLWGTVPDPGGGRVVTYHGWPLYTYLGDASPGYAVGQGKDDDGYWYVMRPSGQIVSPVAGTADPGPGLIPAADRWVSSQGASGGARTIRDRTENKAWASCG